MPRPHSSVRLCRRVRQVAKIHTIGKPRTFATDVSPITHGRSHKIIIVGGGSAGLTVSHKLLRTGEFAAHDIAVIDPAQWHHYQPGWTLVGGGLKFKQDLRKPMASLIDPKLKFYVDGVESFSPDDNSVMLRDGGKIGYEHLIVAPGIKIDYAAIKGLPEALANPDSQVSSIYGYESCDKTWTDISKFKKGEAIFTHPAGVVKCAGAPQKIMWLALDHWKRAGLYDPGNLRESAVHITFATAMSVMFGVPKYSKELDRMREKRGVDSMFQHDLVAVEGDTAIFAPADRKPSVKKHFDFLHAVPKMGPHGFVKSSALANDAGFVDVDDATLQHKKYANVWSLGDASSLPTSKTAAAITAQAPVLVENLLHAIQDKQLTSSYNGYTSCPLLTEYGKVMLAEFKYGGVPEETFGSWFGIDQAVSRRAFYHLKKDFFPWVYLKSMVKGTWAGPKGWVR